jgi:hypothetical protein
MPTPVVYGELRAAVRPSASTGALALGVRASGPGPSPQNPRALDHAVPTCCSTASPRWNHSRMTGGAPHPRGGCPHDRDDVTMVDDHRYGKVADS